MLVEPLLRGPVVSGRDDENAVDGQLREPADAFDRPCGTARAATDDDRGAPPRLLTGAHRQFTQLGVAQGSRFARRAADDYAARAVRQMKIYESRPRVEIDATVKPHGRDDGDQTA